MNLLYINETENKRVIITSKDLSIINTAKDIVIKEISYTRGAGLGSNTTVGIGAIQPITVTVKQV
jgi:hypothetical protein